MFINSNQISFSAENRCIVHLKNIGKIESVIQREINQKEKNQYYILTHMFGI